MPGRKKEKTMEKLKALKFYLILAAVCFGAGYFVKANSGPAKVDTNIVSNYENQIAELKQKLTETESTLEKAKSEQKNKTKVLVKNADGSSTLTESESSTTLENEFLQAKSKTIEYQKMIQDLQSQITQEQKIKNNLLRVDGRIVYDSERGMEYEASGGYQFFSGGAGVNPDKKAWRVSGGLGFNF